ncbi:hypothetical protein E1A91_A05G370800v1 [Gossypium mustelinum]|uniref:Uncharacterized protein n=2 Tax=Gossypium TaxID=3633 RepID=A0A5J5VZI3_GOSBA|nr:hypothetical protein ES319_A05G360400v1 [Gossypium barbadense]TYJ37371.1 hypothetical protein E1A91_A05G370800v1 [Gossypium mustelinum]
MNHPYISPRRFPHVIAKAGDQFQVFPSILRYLFEQLTRTKCYNNKVRGTTFFYSKALIIHGNALIKFSIYFQYSILFLTL